MRSSGITDLFELSSTWVGLIGGIVDGDGRFACRGGCVNVTAFNGWLAWCVKESWGEFVAVERLRGGLERLLF